MYGNREHHNKKEFKGFYVPNSTQVPDTLFDELLTELSGAELKVRSTSSGARLALSGRATPYP